MQLGSTEMTMLWAAGVLGLVHLLLAILGSVQARGMPWAVGARDEPTPPNTTVGARLERAHRNFTETFPLFAAAVLVQASLNEQSDLGGIGAQVYFYSRVLYLPLYALGLPWVRTLAFTAATAGIGIVFATCLPTV